MPKMPSSWLFDDDWIGGFDSFDNEIVEELMEGCWPREELRVHVLNEAIATTIGYTLSCQLLAYQFSTEPDERIVTTAKVVRQSEEVSRNTWLALRCWETGDLNDLHATVGACIIACEELYDNLVQYRPEMYSVDRDGVVWSDMWKTSGASKDCQRALEAFLDVWYEEKVPE